MPALAKHREPRHLHSLGRCEFDQSLQSLRQASACRGSLACSILATSKSVACFTEQMAHRHRRLPAPFRELGSTGFASKAHGADSGPSGLPRRNAMQQPAIELHQPPGPRSNLLQHLSPATSSCQGPGAVPAGSSPRWIRGADASTARIRSSPPRT